MRKLLMLAVMALAALAVMAPSASAAVPYGDDDPQSWGYAMVTGTGVLDAEGPNFFHDCETVSWPGGSSPCPVEVSTDDFTMSANGSPLFTCEGELSTEFHQSGAVAISQVELDGHPNCVVYTGWGRQWSAEICGRDADGDGPGVTEFWLRLTYTFQSSDAVAFASLGGARLSEYPGQLFAEYGDITNEPFSSSGGSLDAHLALSSQVELYGGGSGSCGWPELQS